jgi:hypothetical protein
VFHEQRFVLAEHAGEIPGGQVRESDVAHANKVIRVAPHWRQRSGSSTAPSDDEGQRRAPPATRSQSMESDSARRANERVEVSGVRMAMR